MHSLFNSDNGATGGAEAERARAAGEADVTAGATGGAGAYISDSVKATEQFGAEFAARLKPSDIVAFYGDLGAGKTAFIRGVCGFFGVTEVSSPTFTVVNEYEGETVKIYHFDMYRIKSEADLESIGFFDYTDGIILIEWYENIESFGITPTHTVKIEYVDENSRRVEIA